MNITGRASGKWAVKYMDETLNFIDVYCRSVVLPAGI